MYSGALAEGVGHAEDLVVVSEASAAGDSDNLAGNTTHVATFISRIKELQEKQGAIVLRGDVGVHRLGELCLRPGLQQRLLQ